MLVFRAERAIQWMKERNVPMLPDTMSCIRAYDGKPGIKFLNNGVVLVEDAYFLPEMFEEVPDEKSPDPVGAGDEAQENDQQHDSTKED